MLVHLFGLFQINLRESIMIRLFTDRTLVHCHTSSDICLCLSCIKVDALLVNKGKVTGRDWLRVPAA